MINCERNQKTTNILHSTTESEKNTFYGHLENIQFESEHERFLFVEYVKREYPLTVNAGLLSKETVMERITNFRNSNNEPFFINKYKNWVIDECKICSDYTRTMKICDKCKESFCEKCMNKENCPNCQTTFSKI